ncbi:outer membrane protein [uncultured Martelella sp.]|uniref:outer membrane protein n=1 Tax=uncultured Martelella sp. TaxID=392331 RepID=UPI0029C6C6B6|nr:outer membrane protein [uncultured Martelella sp.]
MKRSVLALAAVAALATTAQAADIVAPTAQPTYTPAPAKAFTWEGVYLGAAGGMGWTEGKLSVPGASESDDFTGGMFGGFAGYNYQFDNNLVLGVEGEINYNWNDNSYNVGVPGSDLKIGTNWQGGIAARAGYAWDKALVYGKAGWSATTVYGEISDIKTEETLNGWTIGAGLDYAFTDKLFGRVEYSYTDFGKSDILSDITSGAEAKATQNRVTVGLGLKF